MNMKLTDLGIPVTNAVHPIDVIKNHPTMVEILADSHGGVLYNVANRTKYDTTDLLNQWNTLTPAEQESADGIIKGAINFITL